MLSNPHPTPPLPPPPHTILGPVGSQESERETQHLALSFRSLLASSCPGGLEAEPFVPASQGLFEHLDTYPDTHWAAFRESWFGNVSHFSVTPKSLTPWKLLVGLY